LSNQSSIGRNENNGEFFGTTNTNQQVKLKLRGEANLLQIDYPSVETRTMVKYFGAATTNHKGNDGCSKLCRYIAFKLGSDNKS
jgi:hypothetical protein